MPSPLTVSRNNYIENPKRSDVPTPLWLCDQIASLFPDVHSVLDPCMGDGRLLAPFSNRGCTVLGYDIKNGEDFLSLSDPIRVDLVVCNPPFNLGVGRKLGSEVFFRHILRLCGELTQTVLMVPMGFRLNQRTHSKRWRWMRDECPASITSVISLPLDCYEGVEFHSEVLIFNAPQLKPHYWANYQ